MFSVEREREKGVAVIKQREVPLRFPLFLDRYPLTACNSACMLAVCVPGLCVPAGRR